MDFLDLFIISLLVSGIMSLIYVAVKINKWFD